MHWLNISHIVEATEAEGPGLRFVIWVQGCLKRCKGCCNGELLKIKPAHLMRSNEIIQLLKNATEKYPLEGLTFLGGEPMEVVNQRELRPFIERIKRELPEKNIWIYSGYTWEELIDENNTRCHSEDTEAILSMIDVLVDGEFEQDKKDVNLRFRGSSNQRVIDVRATRKSGSIVLSPYGEKG